MFMGFEFSHQYWNEASYLCFNGQMRLKNNVNGLAVSGQEMSVANKDEKSIQVLGKPVGDIRSCRELRFNFRGEAISPKPTVCTLRAGEYLSCGIGLSDRLGYKFLNLTSVDIRRWELCASAIIEILKTTSPIDEYNLADTVKIDNLSSFLDGHELDKAFTIHIPNFSMDDWGWDWYGNLGTSLLKETGNLLLYLLRFFIPLTAAYGGIHLSAWNFEFPSRVESILWRTACFIIIGSSFALLTIPSWGTLDDYFVHYLIYEREDSIKLRAFIVMRALHRRLGYCFAGLLLLCYATARLYLVVESFISLRHVPIGVYAAVPWVENIPHV